MRTFAISDIHGNNELFKRALKGIALGKSDRLILLGDLIDRGPDSKGVLDTVFLLKESGFQIECLMGNHERMLLDAVSDIKNLPQWLINGGAKTLTSFLIGSIEKIPNKYIDLIKTFKYFLEEEQFIFVHAGINMKISNPFTDTISLLWERDPYKYLDENWLRNKRVIHGHHPQNSDDILRSISENRPIICIDNGTYIKKPKFGSLCVLEVETLNIQFFE